MERPEEPTPAVPPHRRRAVRSGLVAAGAAVAMTLAGLGVAGAQTGGTTTTTAPDGAGQADRDPGRPRPSGVHRHRGAFLAAAAQAIGIGEADLRAALREGRSMAQVAGSRGVAVQEVVDALVAEARARLAEKVQAGTLTQAQADRVAASLEGRMTALVNRPGRPGRPGHRADRPRHHLRAALATAAQAIGIGEADLRAALRQGRSMAQVAESRGVAVQEVVDALVAEARARLAEKVQAGRLTQAQADEKAGHLAERITALVNRTGARVRHPGAGEDGPPR